MKTIKLYLSLMIVLLAGFACSDDHEPVYTPGETKSAATFTTPAANKEYVLELENKYEVLDVFKWTRAEYPVAVGLQYTLEMAVAGKNFNPSVRIGITTETELEIITNDFNNLLARLRLKPEEKSTVELRILANAFGGEEGITALSDFPQITSQTYTIQVTPYEPEDPFYPTELYMIGKDFGNWEWTSDEVVKMIPVWGKEGEFWCITYFTAGNGFKWSPDKTGDDDFAELDEVIGFTIDDNNAFVAADGLYMVYINYLKGQIAIEKPQVYGIGGSFGEWDEGLYPFTVSGKTMTIKTNHASDELRMYAGSSIATSDWWTREFMIFNDKIEYRGDGGEQKRVSAPAGATITLDFPAGIGSIK